MRNLMMSVLIGLIGLPAVAHANRRLERFFEKHGKALALATHPAAKFLNVSADASGGQVTIRLRFRSRINRGIIRTRLALLVEDDRITSVRVLSDNAFFPAFQGAELTKDLFIDALSDDDSTSAKATRAMLKRVPVKRALRKYLSYRLARYGARQASPGGWRTSPSRPEPSRAARDMHTDYRVNQCFNSNDADACVATAKLYSFGRGGVEKDAALAARLRRKGCELGTAVACNDLGFMYMKGKGVSKDRTLAVQYYRRACNHGFSLSCSNIGWEYYNGGGVGGRNLNVAQRFFKASCDQTETAGCRGLGFFYYHGLGGLARDISRGRALIGRACDGGSRMACRWQSGSMPPPPD
jgi:hypothetical protein